MQDAAVSITQEQLARLRSGFGTSLSFANLFPIVTGFSTRDPIPQDERDRNLRSNLSETCKLLALTDEESAKLCEALKEAVQRLLDLEQASLEIRKTEGTTLLLDFDALREPREQIVSDLRERLRRSLGEHALIDLQVLAGLDDFTGDPEQSLNCELTFGHKQAGWIAWSTVPGPCGRETSPSRFPLSMSYQEVVKATMRTASSGRFAHLENRLPVELAPPP